MKIKYLMIGLLATTLPATSVMATCPKVEITKAKMQPTSMTLTGTGFQKGWTVMTSKKLQGTVAEISNTEYYVTFNEPIGTTGKNAMVTILVPKCAAIMVTGQIVK